MKIFDKDGFSLVELIVVVLIIGVALGIASPYYIDYLAEQRLKGAARMVMSDLMAARQKAVSINQKVKVSFGNNHVYRIWNDADNNGTVADNEGDNLVMDIHPDHHDVTFSASANPVFSPRGTSSMATVTLTSARTGRSKYVKVAITGRIKTDDTP
jgi:type IV fimbrial biogenesis protein FimT